MDIHEPKALIIRYMDLCYCSSDTVSCYGLDGRTKLNSWAKPGVKCVSLITFKNLEPFEVGPVKNGIYTIREVVWEPNGSAGLRLREIKNDSFEYADGFNECTFAIEKFKPLITQQDDLELFNHLLNPSLVDKLDLLAERLDELYTSDAG